MPSPSSSRNWYCYWRQQITMVLHGSLYHYRIIKVRAALNEYWIHFPLRLGLLTTTTDAELELIETRPPADSFLPEVWNIVTNCLIDCLSQHTECSEDAEEDWLPTRLV